MKTKRYAEETPGYNVENKNEQSITFVHEAESEAIQTVLERVVEATLQSGMRFMKHSYDPGKGREHVFLDGEDCSASVISNFVSDLREEEDYSFEFRGTQRSMDHIVVVYESEDLKTEKEEDDEGGE